VIVIYLFEILIDNINARVKWQLAVKSSWAIAAVMGILNLAALVFMKGGIS
jgi:ech hydrogenase subunit B